MGAWKSRASERFCRAGEERFQDRDKKKRQLPEDEAQVVAGGGEERVDLVAILAQEMVSAKPAVGLGVADHRLDRRAPLELAFHSRRQAAAAPGEDDLGLTLVVVAAIALVSVDPLGRDAAHGLGLIDGGLERMAVVGIALEGLGGQEEALAVGRGDPPTLQPNS